MDLTPTAKITAVAAAGGFVTVLAWILAVTTGLDLPVPVATGLTTVIVFVAG